MKLLVIANYFPPVNGSASIEALYYVNKLSELGYKVYVISPDYPSDYFRYDENFEGMISNNVTVIKTYMGKFYSKIYPKNNFENQTDDKVKSKYSIKRELKEFTKKNIIFPDSYFEWRKEALKVAKNLIATEDIDTVISMHESASCHLIGRAIKEVFPSIKWIAYWSDPWTLDSTRYNNTLFYKKLIESRMEKKIVEMADYLLFTTKETMECYIKHFKINQDKCGTVHRGYDLELYDEIKHDMELNVDLRERKINIVHIGELYAQLRDINPLIKALRELKYQDENVYDKINIIFLGGIHDKELISPCEDIECLSFYDRTNFKTALKYMLSADVLLLLGNKKGVQIPGKVYEYLGANAPILTILADKNDPLNKLMIDADKGPVIMNDEEKIKKCLTDIYQSILNDEVPSEWEGPNNKYSWEKGMSEFIEFIEK